MAVTVVMPRLSDSMEEGTIIKWLKKEGEAVENGEPLAEVETDKANMQLDSYASGIMDKIVVGEGGKVPVGEPIAVIRGRDETPSAAAETAAAAEGRKPGTEAVPTATEVVPKRAPEEEEERIKASPMARRIAAERGIDLAAVRGTGPGGRITKEDVEAYTGAAAPRPAQPAAEPVAVPGPAAVPPVPVAPPTALPPTVVPFNRMQATIAKRMAESKAKAPHFYLTAKVDMHEAVALRKQINTMVGDEYEVSFNDLVIKAAALALRRFPRVNASYREGGVELKQAVNIGMAVALPDGLVVPVLKDADRKTVGEIARESRAILDRTRNNRLQTSDFEGGTFTVSNLGMYDIDEFAAVINPPEAGILAVGAIRKEPVVMDDHVAISERMRLTLSCDHRVFYGATGAEFLREIKRLLEQPMNLLL